MSWCYKLLSYHLRCELPANELGQVALALCHSTLDYAGQLQDAQYLVCLPSLRAIPYCSMQAKSVCAGVLPQSTVSMAAEVKQCLRAFLFFIRLSAETSDVLCPTRGVGFSKPCNLCFKVDQI